MSRQNDKEQARQWAREMLSQPPGQVAILDTETCDLHGEVIELALIDTAGNELYNRRFSPLDRNSAGRAGRPRYHAGDASRRAVICRGV